MSGELRRRYVLTEHARAEIRRRALPPDFVEQVLASPEQEETVRPGRIVLQSRYYPKGSRKVYFVRVIVDLDRDPPEVVTVYRTSKVRKYWKESK